jgi:RimJ/RimL family protein N-acetyltransferase
MSMRSPGARIRTLYWGVMGRLRRWTVAANPRAKKRLFFVFDFGATSIEPPDGRITFRELAPAEIEQHQTRGRSDIPRLRMSGAETGCVVGTLDGRAVYHAWYIRADGAALQGLPNGWQPNGRVLFLHDGYTEPAFRGDGIHSAATRWLLSRESGLNTAYAVCLVYADNPVARRAVAKAGFRVVGRSD